MDIFTVGTEVYADRPSDFHYKVGDKQFHGTILQVLPAIRRVPTSYLIQFQLPDCRGDMDTVVVPHFRKGKQRVFKVQPTINQSGNSSSLDNTLFPSCIRTNNSI